MKCGQATYHSIYCSPFSCRAMSGFDEDYISGEASVKEKAELSRTGEGRQVYAAGGGGMALCVVFAWPEIWYLVSFWGVISGSSHANGLSIKSLEDREGGDSNSRPSLLKELCNKASLVFTNVVVREVRIAVLLLPPRETLLHREKKEKEVRMQGSKLYVGNLPYSASNEQLEELFSTYGVVRQVNIIEGRGFGFVEMSSPSEAEKAKEGLDGSEFKGRTLRVDEARPPRSREKRDYRRY
jgi:hypothetical protein